MRALLFLSLLCCLPVVPVHAGDTVEAVARDTHRDTQWPQWRGPLGTGEAPLADPPLTWSDTENIRWRLALPGKGHSTPIVWGDHVFLTAAEPDGEAMPPRPDTAPGAHDNLLVTHRQAFLVLAVDRRTGKLLWERTVHKALPHEGGHNTASLASASPVTDGTRVFAFFGSYGLYCLDFAGEIIWSHDLGTMLTKHGHGEGASPALHGDTLVVNWDHREQSFLVAFDTKTGAERWRVMRDEPTSWATPIVVEHDGRAQVIVPGTNRLRGYDLADGSVIWECSGLSHNIVASPVAANGMIFAGSSYEKQAMLGIRLDGAAGDISTGDRVAWMRRRMTPYVPSLLLHGDVLYFLQHYQPILARVVASTGAEPHRPMRLEMGNVYASPVAAAGRIYITDLTGTTLVMTAEIEPRVLARNRIADSFSASAAIAGKDIFLRGESNLYCISGEPTPVPGDNP